MINTSEIRNMTERELVNLLYDLQEGMIDVDEFGQSCLELAKEIEEDYK